MPMSSMATSGVNSSAAASAAGPSAAVRHDVPLGGQQVAQHLPAVVVVVGDENPQRPFAGRDGRAESSAGAGWRVRIERQVDDELAAACRARRCGPRRCRRAAPTRLRTSVRPTPRPPRVRSSERSPCMNMSKTCRQQLRRDADAGVANADAQLIRAGRRARPAVSAMSQMWPPGGVNLTALFSRLTSTCVSRTGSASQRRPARPAATPSGCGCAASIAGRHSSTAPLTTLVELETLLAQLDLALRDARDVEQVVDDAHHVRDLALEHLPRLRGRRPGRRRRDAASRARSASAPADCAARARGCRGTRPCAGRRSRSVSASMRSASACARVGDVLDGEQQQRSAGPSRTIARALSTSVRGPCAGNVPLDLEVDDRLARRRRPASSAAAGSASAQMPRPRLPQQPALDLLGASSPNSA